MRAQRRARRSLGEARARARAARRSLAAHALGLLDLYASHRSPRATAPTPPSHHPIRTPPLRAPVHPRRRYQHLLDKTVPHVGPRWVGLAAALALYFLRVWMLRGWYIVTYGMGIYLLSLFIGFISPQVRARVGEWAARGAWSAE